MRTDSGTCGIVVFEPEYKGHQPDHVRHLASAWSVAPPDGPMHLIVDARLLKRIPEIASFQRVEVHPIAPKRLRWLNHQWLWLRSVARWWEMRRALAEHGATHGLYLFLDHVQLALALRLPFGPGRTVSGVLFRPSLHYGSFLEADGPTLSERLVNLRKRALYALMLRHPQLTRVLTLDAFFPDYARRALLGGEKVMNAPDPVLTASPSQAPEWVSDVPPDRRLFSIFGFLAARKGVMQTLAALEHLTPDEQGRSAILFAGRLDDRIASDFRAALAGLVRRCPRLWTHFEERYVSEEEIAAILERSDVVLAPYIRFVGSSGVILWAAGAGKPVLTQDFGYVGELVRRRRLGVAVDTRDPSRIAAALRLCLNAELSTLCDAASQAALADECTPERYADEVLASRFPMGGEPSNALAG